MRRRGRDGFQGEASGAKTDRAQLRRALAALGKGDVLLVTRLDRLASSTRDLLDTRLSRSPRPQPRRRAYQRDPRGVRCRPCACGMAKSVRPPVG
ncbi:recombinase family protein [Methylosinus sp. Ce-a6]|uniref:recombinase family protein n=1 Tax=Methylosinus sp. Ce-a6 TaxID=2172005 RepID=UPI001FCE5C7D|nr:recombinase family protein [Methylosinus sp. Ce-a6]